MSIWREPRSQQKYYCLWSMRKVKVLIDSWLLNKWTKNPRQWQSTLGAGTAALGVEGLHEWRTGTTSPDQGILCISNSASSRMSPRDLLFALIMCYSPFCRRTKMGSKENIVSIVHSIHNTARDSFNGNFIKGGFLRYEQSLRIGMEAHSIQFTE